MTDPRKVRLTLARLMRRAHEEGSDADKAQYRLLLDFGKQVLAAMKLESDIDVERRLEAIERALQEKRG